VAILKIGHEDRAYPYLPQLRSWHRWRNIQPALNLPSNQQLVSEYLRAKGLCNIDFASMAEADAVLAGLIDRERIAYSYCPELFTTNKS
jgi:hypothetical protein